MNSPHNMNLQHKTCAMREKPPIKQCGVVLFIALVALVVMSLAAVALIRSVDTSTIIAGNLAFKQSATTSADSGMESAIAWLAAASPATLEANSVANGYYATSVADAKTWVDVDANTVVATGGGIVAGTDASGNTIRYIVQRMCSATGAPAADKCLFGATTDEGCNEVLQPGCTGESVLSPIYRVTARITGPKNTISYTQALIY